MAIRPITPYSNVGEFSIPELAGVQPWAGGFITADGLRAVPDCRRCFDATIEAGSNVLQSATANWQGSEWGLPLAGKFIAVAGAGPDGSDLLTTIESWSDAGTLMLTDPASTTVSGAACLWGTDSTAPMQIAFDECAVNRVPLRLHFGSYLCGRLIVRSGLHLVGAGERHSWLVFKPGTSAHNYAMLEAAGIETGEVTSDLLFQDFGIDGLGGYSAGDHSWHPVQQMSLMFLHYTENVLLESVHFENANLSCLGCAAVRNFKLRKCWLGDALPGNVFSPSGYATTFQDSNGRAFQFAAGSLFHHENYLVPGAAETRDVDISGTTFRGDISNGSCIKFSSAQTTPIYNVRIDGNTIYVGGLAWDADLRPMGAPSAIAQDTLGVEFWNGTFRGVSVTDNTIECLAADNGCFGISLGGAVPPGTHRKYTITGNRIFNCSSFGIELSGSNLTVTGNYIERCGINALSFPDLTLEDLTLTGNTLVEPIPGSFGAANGYPCSAISIVIQGSGGAEDLLARIRSVVIANNTIRLDATILPAGTPVVTGVYIFINSLSSTATMTGIKVQGNIIDGTGHVKENGITFASAEDAGPLEKVSCSTNTLSNMNIGVYIGASVLNSRIHFNEIDQDTVAEPYGNLPFVHASTTIIEHTTDVTGIGAGLDYRHVAVPSLKVRGQGFPAIPEDGNVQLPAWLSYNPYAFFTGPRGVVNAANLVALNSLQSAPNQGSWMTVNTWRKSPTEWEQTGRMWDFTISGTTVTVTVGTTPDETANAPYNGFPLWVSAFSGSGLTDFTSYVAASVSTGPPFTMQLTLGGTPQSGSGSGKMSALPYAMFMQLAAAKFSIGFGKATGTGGTEPWDDSESAFGSALLVHNGRNDAGLSASWRTGVYSAYPFYPEYAYGPGIRSHSSDPNGVKDGTYGMACLWGALDGVPRFSIKTTDWGTLTGWVNIAAVVAFWVSVDGNTIGTPFRIKLTHASYDANRPVVSNGSKELDTDTALDATWIGDGTVTNAEFQHLGDVTSAIQAQLNALDARLDALEGAGGSFVTIAQHNAHDHLYTGDGSGTVSDHTSTANPVL